MREHRALYFLLAALAGIVTGGVLLAVAELIALAVARTASPVLALGAFIVDIVPRPLKEFAIETFGENDKTFLLGSVGAAVVVAAAIAGVLQLVRPPLGQVLLVIAGGLSIAAIVTRTGASPLAAAPTLPSRKVLSFSPNVSIANSLSGRGTMSTMKAPSASTGLAVRATARAMSSATARRTPPVTMPARAASRK
ncbi:hypothetical protein C5D25_02910 [Rathayibacter sp. AY1D7]|nr:hypothetical protein C5D25_02910 [Rathayibacter sp. AY1D7]